MASTPVTIQEIDTAKRREVNRFVMLPFKLYRDTPQWVPPILLDARTQLDRKKNPYYQQNDAAFFVASRNGEDIGRICVMAPLYYNAFKGEQQAHFYLFECTDDQQAANALFDAAADWAHARGLNLFRGPLGFRAFDGFGMLAKGFERLPAVGIPYNHPYYPALAEQWGFELEERVYSGYVSVPKVLAEFDERNLRVAEKVMERYGFGIKSYRTKRALKREVVKPIVDVYNRALTHIAGDPPLSEELIKQVVNDIVLITDPEMLKFITKDGDIIGFMFCFLDISRALQRSKGRLFPFGIFHLLWELRTTRWLNLNGMGIDPEYQGLGGTAVMYTALHETLSQHKRFLHGDVVQISEFNAKSLNEMKQFGVEFDKTHHIYRKQI